MKRILFGALVALIIPISVSALSVDEIRTQIQTLLQQVRELQQQLTTLESPTPVACTMDAKICPDGSSVGRVGPKCEFAACPGGGVTNTPPRWCLMYDTLTLGSRGEDVLALQQAIGAEDLGSTPTGYYGPLTRAVWNKRCLPYYPISSNGITIQGISGPTTLQIGEQGTWSVKATADSAGTLSYSVVWGDEMALTGIASLANGTDQFSQSATFTHTYKNFGVYTPRFAVRNASGASASASITVRVDDAQRPIACTMEYAPVCGAKVIGVSERYDGGDTNLYGEEKTYSNKCMMKADGAVLRHEGACTKLSCPMPSCMARECPAGQHAVADTPVYGANGCQTNMCSTHCVLNSPDSCGPLTGGGNRAFPECQLQPAASVPSATGSSGPIGGGMGYQTDVGYQAVSTCIANGMTFAEGASVNQCISSGGISGCQTFTDAGPRSVCRAGVWVQGQ